MVDKLLSPHEDLRPAPSLLAGKGLLALNDDLLAEILILLPTLADLGRACACCLAFRRVITSPSFLRRLHALHPPSLLGFRVFFGRFQPVPEPSLAARVRALAAAADFRLSFLPYPGHWLVRDARGGRFVVDRLQDGKDGSTEIAVCDPLFRRYVLLPPIPKELADAVQRPIMDAVTNRTYDVFLAPCEKEATAPPQAFRVIWMAQCKDKLVAFIFSSVRKQWRALLSLSWRDVDPEFPALIGGQPLWYRSYAYGCFYWLLSFSPECCTKLIALDMSRMELAPVNTALPSGYNYIDELAIVELGEGTRGMFKFTTRCTGRALQLFRARTRQDHGEGASEWVLEKEVSLHPSSDAYAMLGHANGELILQGYLKKDRPFAPESFCCISVDFKTM